MSNISKETKKILNEIKNSDAFLVKTPNKIKNEIKIKLITIFPSNKIRKKPLFSCLKAYENNLPIAKPESNINITGKNNIIIDFTSVVY